MLDDYERGDEAFTDFVAEVIEENHWNYGWIDHSTEKYDHKRGYTNLSAEFDIPVEQLRREGSSSVWKAFSSNPKRLLDGGTINGKS